MGVDGQGPGRPGQQGHGKVDCGTQGRACFIGALRKGPREAHLLTPPPLWCPSSNQSTRMGRVGSPEKAAETTHNQGLATWDLNDGGHLVREVTDQGLATLSQQPQLASVRRQVPG